MRQLSLRKFDPERILPSFLDGRYPWSGRFFSSYPVQDIARYSEIQWDMRRCGRTFLATVNLRANLHSRFREVRRALLAYCLYTLQYKALERGGKLGATPEPLPTDAAASCGSCSCYGAGCWHQEQQEDEESDDGQRAARPAETETAGRVDSRRGGSSFVRRAVTSGAGAAVAVSRHGMADVLTREVQDMAGYGGIWRDMAGYGGISWDMVDTVQIWSDTLKKTVQSRSVDGGCA